MKKILIILFILSFLIFSCVKRETSCDRPIFFYDYKENAVNSLSDILCERNQLCGKKKNIDWDTEGMRLKAEATSLFFQVNGMDTIFLGIENDRFYLCEAHACPLLFPADNTYKNKNILRISLGKNVTKEERKDIYEILTDSSLLYNRNRTIMVKGEIRFYKSKDDPYFDSKHDYLPELVVFKSEDIQIYKY